MWRFFDDGNGRRHLLGVNLMLNLTWWNLPFVTRATVQLRTFDQRIRVPIANYRAADLTTETFWMESMVASNHDWS
jgi:hypothetical protein